MSTRTAPLATVALVTATLLLNACAGPAGDEPPTATGVVTATVPADGPTSGSTATVGNGDLGPVPAGCATPGLDVVETSFGRYTPLWFVPTGTSGVWFNFEITDNRFDPCLPLSWITLSGANGDHLLPEGSRATMAEAVVFFHHDAPVTVPPPVQFHEIRAVERLADDAVTVTYGHAGGATAHGVTETFTATHTWNGTRPVTSGAGAPTYEAAASQVLTLDLETPPPPHDAPAVLLGNDRASRLAAAHDLRGRSGELTVRVPLRGPGLTCSFTSPAAPVTCRGEEVAWPEIPEGLTGETDWPEPGLANGLGIHHLPTTVSTTRDAPTMPAPEFELPDEALSRVGAYLVDTTGEQVVFAAGDSGVAVTPSSISLVETDYVDTSRW